MRKIFILLLFTSLVAELATAQGSSSRRRDRSLMFSLGIGSSTYHGDLHDIMYDGLSASLRPSMGLGLRKKLGSQLSLRLDLNWYQLGGADSLNGFLKFHKDPDQRGGSREGETDTRYVRNLSFKSNNFEVSALAMFNLLPVKGSYTRRPLINPYIYVGLGFSTNNPQGYIDSRWVPLRPLNTELLSEPYSGIVMVIPVGLGIRLKANQFIDILLEGGRRFTRTDYLDDVSTVYASKDGIRQYHVERGDGLEDLAVRLSDRSAEGGFKERQPGNTRGNSDKNDAYYIFQVRLEMYLPDNFLSQLFSPSRRKPKFR